MHLRLPFSGVAFALIGAVSWPHTSPRDAFNSLLTGAVVGFVVGLLVGLALEPVFKRWSPARQRSARPGRDVSDSA